MAKTDLDALLDVIDEYVTVTMEKTFDFTTLRHSKYLLVAWKVLL